MVTPRILASAVAGAIGCRYDSATDRLLFTEFGGNLSQVDVAGAMYSVLGTGYSEPEDVALLSNGTTALVTERVGNLLKVDLAAADRSFASVITPGLVAPHQIAVFEDVGVAWVIEFDALGRLVEVDLGTGTQTVLAAGFEWAVGLAARVDRSMAFISEQAGTGGRISVVEFPSGTRTLLADGLSSPFFLSWTDASESALLFTERDPANRVSVLEPDGSSSIRRLALLGASFRPSSAALAGSELVVCSDADILAYDVSDGYPAEVKLDLGTRAHYVGSYRRVAVDTTDTGVAFDDLDFVVPEGRRGGETSLSRDVRFDPTNPTVMLLAGYEPGGYRLRAIHRPTGAVGGEAKYELTDAWHNDDRSPSKWFNGILPAYAASATWGGGIAGTPQNYNTIPALGTKRVAVLFVDTSDQRYSTNAATLAGFRTRWQQNVLDGVVGGDGVTRSAKLYYREVSYQTLGLAGMPGMDLDGTIFPDVVHLSGHWGDYFQMDVNGSWQAKGEFYNQCITAAGGSVNLTGFDMIVCVSQAFSSATPNAKVAWPYGGGSVNIDSPNGRITSRTISMPNEWGDGSAFDQGGGRTIYETVCHEMGHTINLPDEYKPDVPGRMLAGTPANASWDPMESEGTLPHFTLPHRMMLGWTQASWIQLYDFLASPGTMVDDTLTLSAVEGGPPPAGQFAGVEVRVGDGRNYYIEYRTGQTGEIGDEQLVPNARVVMVDVSEPPDPPVTSRPDMLLVAQHSDDNGAVLDAGQFYHEVDNSTPTFPSDFRVDVVSHTGNQAVVRVRYGVIGKPDPSIRPWPRDAAHQWQSPDIDVNNARNAADSAWANVPWQGHDNTVVAHVKNRGTSSAPGVVANFFVKDYTVGGAPETFLGFDRRDIGPGATVDFSTPWPIPAPPSPDTPQHFCIIVRIDPYQTPTTPPVLEMTGANNEAQSNYDRFISATSTPSREITDITVGNPYPRPTRFFIGAGQSNPLYRTYLRHSWLRLDPGEVMKVRVMFEFAPDAEQSDPRVQEFKEKYFRVPNFVNVIGLIEDPGDPRLHGPWLVTGVSAEVGTGKSTRFDDVKQDGRLVFGNVVTNDGIPVPSGSVVLTRRGEKGEDLGSEIAPIEQGGAFHVVMKEGWFQLECYYTGAAGYADCETVLREPSA
jgi:hypothetical protein